jgi:adenine-specific DNA-methyltransferase
MTLPIDRVDLESLNIADLQKKKLKELFPEVFTEGGKIDFDKLKLTLGQAIDAGKERFGMQWAGKADCFKTIQQPSVATLVPCPEESIDFDTTENVFIEGDNLEVLKLLQKSYLGKIKMIYIDPPYNTGKDFVYPDNYSENLDTYLEYTGQIDGEGRKFSTNLDTDGRFHSKWINMMYPRIFLAKNLLKEDGIIFISISDAELANLISICHEIFGENNFLADIIWNSTKSVTNTALISVSHTHTLVYCKSLEFYKNHRESFRLLDDGDGFENPDNDPRGAWKADPFQVGGWRPNQQYEIQNPNTGVVYTPNKGCSWKNDLIKFNELLKDERIVFGKTGEGAPQRKRFMSEAAERGKVSKTLWDDLETTTNGTQLLKNLFDGNSLFDNPKPISLIKRMMELSAKENDVILDFFAGSATTAHAVMDFNYNFKKAIKYICIQLPEIIDSSQEAFALGYRTIAEISKERIRRAEAKIKAEIDENTDLLTEEKAPLDLGFRVFKLQKSNFKVWDATLEKDATNIQLALEAHIDHIDPNATQQAILFELLLKAGFELTTPIETLTLANKIVFSIAEGALLICLEKELTLDLIKAIADLEPSRVIVMDEGFQNNDQLKTNASLTLKAKGVVDFRTV